MLVLLMLNKNSLQGATAENRGVGMAESQKDIYDSIRGDDYMHNTYDVH